MEEIEERDVHNMLAQAAAFARAEDPSGAVTRARLALELARDPSARAEAALELERFEAVERAWRRAAEERGAAGEIPPPAPSARRVRPPSFEWRRPFAPMATRPASPLLV